MANQKNRLKLVINQLITIRALAVSFTEKTENMKKVIKYLSFTLLMLVIINCKKNTELIEKTDTSKSKKEISVKETPKNNDENFNTFLEVFSKDSLFQISRVKYLLIQKEWIDPEKGTVEKLITKKTYEILDFTYPKDALTREFDRYTQKIKTNKNKTVIEIRGVDNGIYSDYFFEKLNGKWMLISCSEQST